MEVTLAFKGEYDDVTAIVVVNQIGKVIKNLRGILDEDGMRYHVIEDGGLYVKFSLIGSNKVDVAYRLEQMVSTNLLMVNYLLYSSRFQDTIYQERVD